MYYDFRRCSPRRVGFSLVELLVVIAVIGVITLIAVPLFSSVKEKSERAKTMRNAQNAASIAEQAMHAGNLSVMEAPTKEEALALISVGVTGKGSLEMVRFRLDLSAEEQVKLLPYLDFIDGHLMVNSNPVLEP